MIRQQAALLRQVQAFFYSHLVGLYDWRNARIAKQDEVPEEDRLEHDARWLAQARVVFGPYEILIQAPAIAPPLGGVQLRTNDVNSRVLVSGAIDVATWDYIADFIKQHQEASTWQEKRAPISASEWQT